MSVTSVTTALLTPYGSVSGNSSRSAKYAALADPLQGETAAKADAAAVTGFQVNGRTTDSAAAKDGAGAVDAGDVDSADGSQFQSAFADALRADGTTAGKSKSGASESGGGQSSAGLALYKRVSQIGNNEFSPSALLKSWNSIMQEGQEGGEAAVATLKAFLQGGASGHGSGVLDVTA